VPEKAVSRSFLVASLFNGLAQVEVLVISLKQKGKERQPDKKTLEAGEIRVKVEGSPFLEKSRQKIEGGEGNGRQ